MFGLPLQSFSKKTDLYKLASMKPHLIFFHLPQLLGRFSPFFLWIFLNKPPLPWSSFPWYPCQVFTHYAVTSLQSSFILKTKTTISEQITPNFPFSSPVYCSSIFPIAYKTLHLDILFKTEVILFT